MPLPEYYWQASLPDLSHRLTGSIVEFKGAPVIVSNVHVGSLVPHSTHVLIVQYDESRGDFNKISVPTNDPALSVHRLGERCGVMITDTGVITHLIHVPVKHTLQGLSPVNLLALRYGNGVFGDMLGRSKAQKYYGVTPENWDAKYWADAASFNKIRAFGDETGVRYELLALLKQTNFRRHWIEGYNARRAVFTFQTDNTLKAIPVSPLAHLERDEFAHAYVCYKGRRVGVLQNSRVKYLASKAYLAGEIERNVGLPPI